MLNLTKDNTEPCVVDKWGACSIRVYQELGQTTTVLGAGFLKSTGKTTHVPFVPFYSY